jgi:tol-pal system protein YbgF
MRNLLLAAALTFIPALALSQDRAQSLADIRAEVSALSAEFNALKQELVASGQISTGIAGGDALQRMDTIEAALARLTAKAEEVELRLNRVVTDGSNRIGDIEFRLCELTEGCDIATLPATPTLGGDGSAPVVQSPLDPVASTGGPELAVNEQADFDRAREVLGTGDFRAAADLFQAFTQTYQGGPLTQEAHVLRGDALTSLGETANAARAYLAGFESAQAGVMAPLALLRLGESLGQLGSLPEACVTLAEVQARFPLSPESANAQIAAQGLGCQ